MYKIINWGQLSRRINIVTKVDKSHETPLYCDFSELKLINSHYTGLYRINRSGYERSV